MRHDSLFDCHRSVRRGRFGLRIRLRPCASYKRNGRGISGRLFVMTPMMGAHRAIPARAGRLFFFALSPER
jgi:hypothetical protein